MTISRIMKAMNKIKYAILALAAALLAGACSTKEFDEITDLNLNRCLAPMGLEARVSNALGNVVTFTWDVSKDAEAYVLRIYTDESFSRARSRTRRNWNPTRPTGAPCRPRPPESRTPRYAS